MRNNIMKLYPVLLASCMGFWLAGCASPASTPASPAVGVLQTPAGSTSGNGDARAPHEWSQPLPEDPASFAHVVAAALRLPAARVQSVLASAQYNPEVARLMAPASATSGRPIVRNWPAYRRRFVEPVRIRHGVTFWHEHLHTLQAAEEQYGVPAAIIVAILGVETIYGRNTGSFPVLDALYTLAFAFPKTETRDRSPYFRKELAEFLALTLVQGVDPRSIYGSYAGAIGMPQFMPGSIRRYAVAANGNALPDLQHNPADAIFSIANYLAAHGWQRGLPVFAPVRVPSHASHLAHGKLEPTLAWPDLVAAGATLIPWDSGNSGTHGPTVQVASLAPPPLVGQAVAAEGFRAAPSWMQAPLGIVDLPHGRNGPVEYRVATPNFFAITHYNRSYFYATAVAELAAALEAAMKKQ